MRTVVAAADLETARRFAADAELGPEAAFWTVPGASDDDRPGSSAALARALVAFEQDASGQQMEPIVLADDSDAALAAALVGSKLLIPVLAGPAATDPPTANARLIAQLAAAYTRSA